MRAAAGGQISAPGQQLHGFHVDVFVTRGGVPHRLAALGKGRRIQDNKIKGLFSRSAEFRQEIENIRGVSCDFAVNKLLEYNLIQEVGRKNAPGRPMLFGTTEQFLRSFGVKSLEELPQVNPAVKAEFQEEAENEAKQIVDI